MKAECGICTRIHSKKYKRYGGYCCSACALFFRRSIYKNHKYVCYGKDDACLKNPSKLGSHCRKCRFAKCLGLGMNIHGMTTLKQQTTTAPTQATTSSSQSTPSTTATPTPVSTSILPAVVPETVTSSVAPTVAPIAPAPENISQQPFFDEMFLFAETINAIVETFLKHPELLQLYYVTENRSLHDSATENFHKICDSSMDRILCLLGILIKYPITFEELDIFCAICINKLTFPSLSQSQQIQLSQLQNTEFKKILSENKMEEKRRLELFYLAEHCLEKFI